MGVVYKGRHRDLHLDVAVKFLHPHLTEQPGNAERFLRGATASARDRVKLLKLVWDFVGTEFGGRQLQYEMFYSAAQPIVNTRMFRSYDWERAKAAVDRCLGEY